MYFIYCTSSTPSFILWGSHIALAIRGYKWVYHSNARKLPTCMEYIYLLLFVFSYPVLSCLILSVPSPFCFILSCLDWSVYPSTFYLYVYLSVCLSVCLSMCLSIDLSIDWSFFLSHNPIQSNPIQPSPVQSNPPSIHQTYSSCLRAYLCKFSVWFFDSFGSVCKIRVSLALISGPDKIVDCGCVQRVKCRNGTVTWWCSIRPFLPRKIQLPKHSESVDGDPNRLSVALLGRSQWFLRAMESMERGVRD